MKRKSLKLLCVLSLTTLVSCSQDNTILESNEVEESTEKLSEKEQEPHRYGGWYCPDNLRGFPAVDIDNWKEVPVVNGRMATKEETQNGASLISVDMEKYPNAKPLDMEMPQLARFYNRHSGKEEIIIVIQALNISNDSIVGFRYLNGGNGSARLNEVKFISDSEVEHLSSYRFVSFDLNINATQAEIYQILTKDEYGRTLQTIFDEENQLEANWNESSKVNFKYGKSGELTSAFAGDVFGCLYIQIDAEKDNYQYVEKFLLVENQETKTTKLQVVCGTIRC